MVKREHSIIPEAVYPASFRQQETDDILTILRQHQSVTIVGMKRVGVSNFLRFITHNPKIRARLNNGKQTVFVYLDTNDLTEITLQQFWLLLLKRLHDTATELPTTKQEEVDKIYQRTIATGNAEPLFLLEGIKEIAAIYASTEYYLVIALARFDRLLPVFSETFFANLQSIVDIASEHITYIFTTYLPFSKLCREIYFAAKFSMFTKTYYLKPLAPQDLYLIIDAFERQRDITLPKEVRDILVHLSGGHVQLLQLCLVVVSEIHTSPNTDEGTLLLTLNPDERIGLQCDEILESLTPEEKSYLLAGQPSSQKPSDYLLDTGIMIKNGSPVSTPGGQKLFSAVFERYLQHKQKELSLPQYPFSDLTKKETLLLTYLVDHKGEICPRDEMIGAVWPEFEDISDWALDQLVSRLRRKLEGQGAQMKIKTNRGKGYQLLEYTSEASEPPTQAPKPAH